MTKFKHFLSNARFRINLPFISYEFSIDDLVNSENIDERISKLESVKKDLYEAISAVNELQSDAQKNKDEVESLKFTVERLQEDKNTAEKLLKVPQDSFVRLFERASSKGRLRGWIEGLIIGFISGVLSSILVWYITNKIESL